MLPGPQWTQATACRRMPLILKPLLAHLQPLLWLKFLLNNRLRHRRPFIQIRHFELSLDIPPEGLPVAGWLQTRAGAIQRWLDAGRGYLDRWSGLGAARRGMAPAVDREGFARARIRSKRVRGSLPCHRARTESHRRPLQRCGSGFGQDVGISVVSDCQSHRASAPDSGAGFARRNRPGDDPANLWAISRLRLDAKSDLRQCRYRSPRKHL